MIPELVEAARLCEEQGFPGPAVALKVADGPALKLFAVLERRPAAPYWVEPPKKILPTDGVPCALYSWRDGAEADALGRNVEALRTHNILNYLYNVWSMSGGGYSAQWAGDFEVAVSEILGSPFRLGVSGRGDLQAVHDLPPMFPSGTSDDQLRRIARLFTRLFFYVEEVEFGDQSEGPRRG